MADSKKPDEKTTDPTPATPPDAEGELGLSDEQLDKIAGGLARLRFDRPKAYPISDTR